MIKAVRGFKDIYGVEMLRWQKLEEIIKEGFRLWGFEEVRIPLIEKTELFQRGIGDDTDIVEKEMYTFLDKGGEKVTLRPEGTASIIRFFNEHKLYGVDNYFKFFYIGPMFRYERPQKGRLRQFHQAGVELLGDTSPMAELEVLTLIFYLMEKLGIRNIELKLNSLGCDGCRKAYREALIKYYQPKEPFLCNDCKRRLKVNPLRLIDCKSEGCQEIAKDAPVITNFLCLDCKRHFETLKNLLSEHDIPFAESPYIVRGLDYYNRTVFELHSKDLGAQSALLAGGRYDSLSANLGGVDIPAVGWAVGLERIAKVIENQNLVNPDELIYIVYLGEKAQQAAIKLVYALRRAKKRAEFDVFNGSLKSQFRKADRLSAKWVVVLGERELELGAYQIKNMTTGEQKSVFMGDIINFFCDDNRKG